MRRAAKVDANQAEIVAALRKVGAFVQSLAMVGQGCVDLLVGYRGCWFALEIKDGSKSPSEQKLTPDEQRWHEQAGLRAPVFVVRSVEEALEVITNRR